MDVIPTTMNDHQLPQRKSPRLQGYDYSQSGAYFITICTYKRQHLFGHVVDGEMNLNRMGGIAEWHWYDLPTHFPQIELDAFVVMPNHMHGIVVIFDDVNTDAMDRVPTAPFAHNSKITLTLGTIIGTYKAAVTRHANRELANSPGAIWQSRYHDHIIRSEKALNQIRAYVLENPARWQEDQYYS